MLALARRVKGPPPALLSRGRVLVENEFGATCLLGHMRRLIR